jgi:LPXTG-motif cell wall-anchored protein
MDSSLKYLRPSHLLMLRSSLSPLPAVEEEIKSLSVNFRGQFLYGESANERIFKEQASKYSVLHLAMHGLLNQDFPMLSSLAFSEDMDRLEDNFLQAYEIAQLHLNSDLVVLSACETGFGKFRQGEGIMSLARSFMYAGVPSLVVSLWQVNDHSTSVIMKYFYANLTKGMTKAAALRQAKLDYIKTVGDGGAAHPAFWAAFIQLGDSRPLTIKLKATGSSYWIYLISGLGVVVIGFGLLFWFRRKRR